MPKTTTTVPPRAATQVMLPAGTCTWTGLGTAPIPVDLATAQPEQVLEGGTDLYAAVIWFGAAYRGDIDGDGAADVIVAVICSGGGSGSTTELHAYAHDGTALGTLDYGSQNTTKPPFASLGDREAVTGVDITPQAIAVHYVAHTDADPMCCPSLVVTDVFVHRGATFVLTDRHSAPAPGS